MLNLFSMIFLILIRLSTAHFIKLLIRHFREELDTNQTDFFFRKLVT